MKASDTVVPIKLYYTEALSIICEFFFFYFDVSCYNCYCFINHQIFKFLIYTHNCKHFSIVMLYVSMYTYTQVTFLNSVGVSLKQISVICCSEMGKAF